MAGGLSGSLAVGTPGWAPNQGPVHRPPPTPAHLAFTAARQGSGTAGRLGRVLCEHLGFLYPGSPHWASLNHFVWEAPPPPLVESRLPGQPEYPSAITYLAQAWRSQGTRGGGGGGGGELLGKSLLQTGRQGWKGLPRNFVRELEEGEG